MGLSASSDTRAFALAATHSVAPSTRKAYERAVEGLREYARAHNLPCSTGDELLAAAAGYLGSRIRGGYAAAAGQQLHSALAITYPELGPALRALHRGVRGWAKLRPSLKRPPLVRPLAVAMGMWLVSRGYPAEGAAIILGHHCYLRVGELLRVEVWHVVGPHSPRTGFTNRFGFVHIPKAKTGDRQDVELTDAGVGWIVAVCMRAAYDRSGQETALLFPCPQATFRKRFGEAAAALGLPATITPHSMRHGGATHDHASGERSAAEIQSRGRWRSDKSMAIYIGQMRSALATLRVPDGYMAHGAALQKCLPASFRLMLSFAPDTAEVRHFRRAMERVDRGRDGGTAKE